MLLLLATASSGLQQCGKPRDRGRERDPYGVSDSGDTSEPRGPKEHRDGSQANLDQECPAKLPAPQPLPGSRPEHRQVGFWIGRLRHPDGIVLSAEAIAELGQRALARGEAGGRIDLLAPPDSLSSMLTHMAEELRRVRGLAENGTLVTLNGAAPSRSLFASIEAVQESYEPSTNLRYVRGPTSLRRLATETGLYEVPVDAGFDQLQSSTLRPGEMVREVGKHPQGWVLVQTAYASGWIREEELSAPVSEASAGRYLHASSFVAVTSDRAAVWDTPQALHPLGAADIGLRLPLLSREAGRDRLRVLWPGPFGLVEGWMDRSDAHVGYLPLTQRNVFVQALRMLDQPYGWGGRGGGRDCSSFLMDLFAVFGLLLPRHSAAQAASGTQAIEVPPSWRSRQARGIESTAHVLDQILDADVPRLALLHLDGHIMLLLGRDGSDYYAVHDFSGYRVPCRPGHDTKMAVDRVAVTSLDLGEASERGSFASRLNRIVLFGQPLARTLPSGL